MQKEHRYAVEIHWTGNRGEGTAGYQAYGREHTISAPGKPLVQASSDPAFRGDASRYNPEELLVASLAACHMLWFLHLCADSGVVAVAYTDSPTGIMAETADGGFAFREVCLRPQVTLACGTAHDKVVLLHGEARKHCFIARSVNFPVRHEAVTKHLGL